MVRPLHIRGAHIWDGKETAVRDLYTDGDRIVAVPVNGAQVIDLDGYTIFPGLINAHDHLELNHYPRSKFRESYDNARQWHEDMNVRLNDEPYKSLRAYPLWDKLFIGGLKNLLCGATTVAHHNPPHKDLWRKEFPVRVLKNYGWSHSFYLATDEEIQRSYRSTPKEWPWFIHLAEGTDEVAAGEFPKLETMSCIADNTMMIHGVGIHPDDVLKARGGLIICPTTNQYLLDALPDEICHWQIVHVGNIALGSDSRLTSEGDLLHELKIASSYCWLSPTWMVTTEASKLFHLSDSGNLLSNAYADMVIFAKTQENIHTQLCNSSRADLALVVKGGVPQIGDLELMAKFTDVKTVDATLDGKRKAIHIDLAKRIHANALKEQGLEVDSVPKRKLFQFI